MIKEETKTGMCTEMKRGVSFCYTSIISKSVKTSTIHNSAEDTVGMALAFGDPREVIELRKVNNLN